MNIEIVKVVGTTPEIIIIKLSELVKSFVGSEHNDNEEKAKFKISLSSNF